MITNKDSGKIIYAAELKLKGEAKATKKQAERISSEAAKLNETKN